MTSALLLHCLNTKHSFQYSFKYDIFESIENALPNRSIVYADSLFSFVKRLVESDLRKKGSLIPVTE